ncbi:MAG: hypothetical protein ACI9E1_000407 [Cryomorphaceae bacterium]|jgi:hypothetical protein
MKKIYLIIWLLIPLGVVAYHYGPGQKQLTKDRAQRVIDSAFASVEEENYAAAVKQFGEALALLTDEEKPISRRVRLELAKARMLNSELPKAREEIQALITDLAADKSTDKETDQLLRDARSTFANSRYYMTYLMKLEALPREYWEPEIEAARQEYKLLAKQSTDEEKAGYAKDLEATINLARADLDDLQGKAIPKQ